MIWLTWRQHRKQALFTLAGLAALAALMVPTGLAMRRAFDDQGLADCVDAFEPFNNAECNTALIQFMDQYEALTFVPALFFTLPLLVGLFWGAPLIAREVEQGTHRLVWTQGTSRRRWALVKLGFVGAATLVAAAIYGLGVSWWIAPLFQADRLSRFETFSFDAGGVVPIGYTLFAVALGIFAGTVWPKVLPAMAATLAGFVGLRLALTILARPRYLPAESRTQPISEQAEMEAVDDWVIARNVRNANGEVVSDGLYMCADEVGPDGQGCGSELGLTPDAYNWQLYQPADRYWPFQGIETGIFVALAALLVYLAIRRLRRIA
jgi:hypothetical protein